MRTSLLLYGTITLIQTFFFTGDHMVAIIVPSITAASLVIAAIVVIFCLKK